MQRIAVLLLACTLSLAASEVVNLYTYSEYIDPDIPAQFAKATGLELKIDVYESQEEMLARLQAGGLAEYDVLIISDVTIPGLVAQKFVQPLDYTKIPNAVNLMPSFKGLEFDAANTYSLPYLWGPIGIAYRKGSLPDGFGWKSLLDPEQMPGPVVLMDEMRTMMGCVLIAQGKDPNTTDKATLVEAGKVLLKAKASDKCLGFDGGVGALNKVLAGQAVAAVVYNGDAVRAMSESDEITFAIPAEGSLSAIDNLLISAKAKNVAGAHAFINYIYDAKVGAQNANYIQYATPNQASLELITPDDRANPAIYPPLEMMSKLKNLKALGADEQLFEQVWQAIKAR